MRFPTPKWPSPFPSLPSIHRSFLEPCRIHPPQFHSNSNHSKMRAFSSNSFTRRLRFKICRPLPCGVTYSHAPLHIPQELVFNPNLEGHRCSFHCALPLERIVNKMLASPSLIALRIDSIISYLSSVIDVSDDPVLDLLVHNLVLVDAYLNASPLLTTTISVDGVSTPFQLSSTLTTPLGTFQRAGIVKVRLIRLVECILRKASICAIHTIAMASLHSTFIVYLPTVFHA